MHYVYPVTQLKLHTGMRYKGVTQRCCPLLLLCLDNKQQATDNKQQAKQKTKRKTIN